MSSSRRMALLTVHLAVALFGLAGVLGKLTALSSVVIVLGRVIFGSLALAGLLGIRRTLILPRRLGDLSALAASGALLAVHWTAFFQAVRISTVAIALLSYSTFPVFTTALEPIILRERPRRLDIMAAILILPGMYFVVPSLSLNDSAMQGAMWGVLAGFTFALLSIWNRRLRRSYPSAAISFYQDSAAALLLLPTLLFMRPSGGIGFHDLLVLVVLGVFCTAMSHTMFIEGMRTLTAQTASVIAGLEPVWGILFAFILLAEVPSVRTILGGVIVVGATLLPALAPQK